MIPKKIILFGILVMAGLGYLLKERSISELQGKDTQEFMKKKELSKKLKEDPQYLEKQKAQEIRERGYRFLPNECYTNKPDGWEFVKILGVEKDSYKVVFCHKYKGCTEQQLLPFPDLEYEFSKAKKIKCSR